MINAAKTSRIAFLIGIIFSLISCQSGIDHPNFILLMVDDLGWGDTGFNGNTEIQTPNLDQLASSGIIFNRFYSASPVCSPTRASCLTGRNPYRMGIPTANKGFLPKSEITIAELLKEEGYVTGHFGKWHLGTFTNQVKDANRGRPDDSSHLSVPSDHGFDTFFSTESKVPTWNPMEKPIKFDKEAGESLRFGWMARNKDASEFYGTRYWTGVNEEVKDQLEGNDTEIIMDQALEFISQSARNKETFFAVIWTHTPHLPVVIDEEYALKYPDEDFTNQLYYGSITALDDQIGRLWNQLDSLNIKDNTCIFFCSDNGPEVRTPGSAGPFRGKKRDLYEGGIRVPAFCVWPNGIPARQEIDFPSVTSDYLPTILEILNLPNPKNVTLDGISLFPAIKGKVTERSSPIGFRFPGKMSWVTQSHKLISADNGETFELYNLLSDPSEQKNIISENPDLADSLNQSLQSWLKEITKPKTPELTTSRYHDFPTSLKPNILLIYSDDQGSIDLNCYGATDLYTPNLDKLASDGIRFTQFYAGSSVCSPSRAALMTGMSPQAAGLPGNTSSQPGHPGMPNDRVTIAEILKEAGYATAHIGKWHMGYSDDTEPLAQGFDYSFGHMGGCIDNYSHYFYWNGPNRHDLWENNVEVYQDGEYFPDLMVEKATGFFKIHQEQPFFMYFAINLPHYPLQPSPKWRDYYKDLEMPRRDYAAFISVVDERVGQLISSLEELGLRENTVIIFQSDQGHSCESRAFNGGGNAGEFRGAKASLFEGGIRVPAILNWPSQLPRGLTNNIASINYDWFPTIAELCGVKTIPSAVEGKSLLPILENPMANHHKSFRWKLGRQWAVRQGDWKLLGNPTDPSGKYPIRGEQDQLFLVNLDQDVSEKDNLATLYPEKVEELIKLYLEWEYGFERDIPHKQKK